MEDSYPGSSAGYWVYWEHWRTLKPGTSWTPHPWAALLPGFGVTYEGLLLMVQRGLEQVAYTSLCLPNDIHHCGMSHVPSSVSYTHLTLPTSDLV